jgi:Ca-activated chloride channel family protein
MRTRTKYLALLALTSVLAGGATTQACFMRSPLPVQVWLDHISVEITDQVAVKTYDCTFRNANAQAVVGGTCYMELEPGAQIDNMSVLVDGKELKAEILDVDKAKKVFTDIVKNGGSPALLEYFGSQLIQTQVPRIAPNSTIKVKLTYTTVLKKRGDLIRLQMLNTNPKALMQPLKSASVSVKIKSAEPIKNIYSPTHDVKIVETEGWDVGIEWSQENYMPKHPFVLYYQTVKDAVGASLLAHRELDEPGTFMMMLSPTMGTGSGQITDADILPKDVVFCVDTSGSMLQGKKMDQARSALKYCVESLRKGDRFNIVDFSTVARHFNEDGLVALDDASKAKALKYVDKLHARGGTAIEEALSLSLEHLAGKSDRLKMIVFATDGLPTIGERNPEAILKSMATKNKQDVRIFVFGEGFDVNTKLLDFLALDHRGEADYILPNEDITKKISRFFDRVGSPVMTDLKVKFDGLEVSDVYPTKISDVFKGEQVIIYGRYTGHGTKQVTLTGHAAGKTQTFTYTLDFPEYSEDDKSSFVPRLWAGRKVDFLLNEIRKQSEPEKELINEVTYLAKRYGIITPYTSFLVTDDIATRGQQQLAEGFGNRLRRANAAKPGAPQLVRDAKKRADGRRKGGGSGGAKAFYDSAASELSLGNDATKEEKERAVLSAIRYIGSKTFYKQRDASWYESTYETKYAKNVTEVKIGSKKYFDLLSQDGRIAKYLALSDVVMKVNGKWYRFKSAKKPTK